ncbi:anaerobic ribonucleoside-triphosphate reductase activating protein [Methanonatronarchaeum sp. AMET-Sl]|uniref:anaerobic ribonucleoside-triphosphate reductase activating protein n=1 Tax=Methanonatronarchaeum sp. AMET-Sl TaxID=3037654 RepID=UPI00244DC8A3|nr:anaerobic ribonucleoside-triphosphate reductase activating protein [Methanonatronarchaeum sp. AMET-Sl]WGI17807.1 anaerobic ribonucleoside-triphosphate reductase activating protein [Methanonatronarchaeum sp. AMET-Sl]
MKFNFGGKIPLTTIDWPGKPCMSIYFRGCNFRCPYCQNHDIISGKDERMVSEITREIRESSRYIEGVNVSGGEPTMQIDALIQLARRVKELDLGFGVQTNGSYPERVLKLIDTGLVDFISLDIKAPLSNEELYSKVAGTEIDTDKIEKSLNHLKRFEGECEITTTLFRGKVGFEEVQKIVKDLDGIKYVIQQGNPENSMDSEYRNIEKFSREELIEMAKQINYPEIMIRTAERGEEKI